MNRMNKMNFTIILFYGFIVINNLVANEYYVNNHHPLAGNANSGFEESPWLTIQHAADVMTAGDICYVKEGIYDEQVSIKRSGQVDNYITFKAVGNVTMRGFSIIDCMYIRVIGFEITHNNSNTQSEAICLIRAHGCEFLDNYIHHTYSLGIWMRQESTTNNVLIRGNKIAYIGVVSGHEVGEIAIKIWGDNNIVEYNDFSHVGDFLNVWGKKNIVRNNYFHDCYYSDFPDFSGAEGHHTDGFQYWSDDKMLLISTLVENNLFVNNVVQHGHVIFLRDFNSTGSSHFIFRNNIVIRNGSYPFSVENNDYVKVYNNTLVDVLYAQSPKAYYCVSFTDYANYGSVINNVFFNSVRNGGSVYYVDSESVNGFYGDYNLTFNADNANSTWSAPISNEIHGILNRDPRFKNYINDDFHLQNNSPCISTAGPLTKTTSSGNGDDIRVYDAKYFTDGWGITEGDYIRVGSNDSLKILAINYENNVITVNRGVSWISGDKVNLVFQGFAPDMGAFEYREDENYQFGVKIVKPLNGSRLNGAIAIEIEATNEECIRQIIVSVNGLPEMILRESPYKYEWNTEDLPSGEYKIEARAYARYASSNLMQSDMINLTVNKIESPAKLRFIK